MHTFGLFYIYYIYVYLCIWNLDVYVLDVYVLDVYILMTDVFIHIGIMCIHGELGFTIIC